MSQQGPGWTLVGTPENGAKTRYIIMDHSHGVQQFEMAPRNATDTGEPIVPQAQHAAHVLSAENAPTSCVPDAAQLQVADSDTGVESTQLKDNVVADDGPTLDIIINNVVCCFATRCHLNLKRIAQEGMNVIYRRDCGVSVCLVPASRSIACKMCF